MLSWSACGSAAIAANVSAPLVNSCDCWTATGATIEASRPEALMNRASCVFGSARFLATGRRYRNRGERLSMASFSEPPRPANAEPKPIRSALPALRVF